MLLAGRVWHNGSAQPYLPDGMRKVLFLGYGYRWLRPRDNMTVREKKKCFPTRGSTWGVPCEQVGHFMERSAPIVRAMPMPPLTGAHELTPNALPLAPPAPRRIHVRAGLHLAQRRGRPAPVSPPQTAFLLCSVSALAAFSHRRRCAFRAWITARMDEEAVRACTEQFRVLTSAARL